MIGLHRLVPLALLLLPLPAQAAINVDKRPLVRRNASQAYLPVVAFWKSAATMNALKKQLVPYEIAEVRTLADPYRWPAPYKMTLFVDLPTRKKIAQGRTRAIARFSLPAGVTRHDHAPGTPMILLKTFPPGIRAAKKYFYIVVAEHSLRGSGVSRSFRLPIPPPVKSEPKPVAKKSKPLFSEKERAGFAALDVGNPFAAPAQKKPQQKKSLHKSALGKNVSFTGKFDKSGQPHGRGTLTHKITKRKIIGVFVHGKTTTTENYELGYADGSAYLGKVNAAAIPHGKGVHWWKDRRHLKGEFRDGVPWGVMTLASLENPNMIMNGHYDLSTGFNGRVTGHFKSKDGKTMLAQTDGIFKNGMPTGPHKLKDGSGRVLSTTLYEIGVVKSGKQLYGPGGELMRLGTRKMVGADLEYLSRDFHMKVLKEEEVTISFNSGFAWWSPRHYPNRSAFMSDWVTTRQIGSTNMLWAGNPESFAVALVVKLKPVEQRFRVYLVQLDASKRRITRTVDSQSCVVRPDTSVCRVGLSAPQGSWELMVKPVSGKRTDMHVFIVHKKRKF